MTDGPEKVMSALEIDVKDLNIVCGESKRLGCSVPLANVALQQFLAGASLGLGKEDDSSIVKVYESLSNVSVQSNNKMQL